MVRAMARIECSIGNRGSTVTVKVQFIPQFQHARWELVRCPSGAIVGGGCRLFRCERRGRRRNSVDADARREAAISGEKFLEDFYDIPGWRRPMRLMLIVGTVAVAMLLDLRVSQATQMPWCAGTTKGDFFSYNCTLPTYEMCVQEVIAGNRGFCGPNPYYRGPEFVPARAKRKR